MLLVPLGGLLLLALLFDYLVVVGPMRSTFDRSLADAAMVFAAYVRDGPDGRVTLELPRRWRPRARRGAGLAAALRAVRGGRRVLAGDRRLPAPAAAAGERSASHRDARLGGRRMRIVWYRFRRSAAFGLTVAEPTRRPRGPARPLVTATLTLDVLQLVAVVALVLIGVRRGLRPLLEFRDELASRSARELEPLDERRVPVEIGRSWPR